MRRTCVLESDTYRLRLLLDASIFLEEISASSVACFVASNDGKDNVQVDPRAESS